MPLDLESRTQFRILEGRIGKERALAAVYLLFRELGYCAQDDELGLLGGPRVELFRDSIRAICATEDLAVQGCFLRKEESAAFFCPLFSELNRHLDRHYVPMQKAGGLARAAKCKAQQAEAEAIKQGEMLQPELLVKMEGAESKPMSEAEKNRTLMLIKLLDNVLGRKARMNSEFTPGLIADAYVAMQKADESEVDALVRHFLSTRERRGVGLRTEDVLREWEAYLGRVALAA